MPKSIVGVPREIKEQEQRVSLVPSGAYLLVQEGHRVLVETGAGMGSGISDEEYIEAGAEIAENSAEVFEQAQIVAKVKEPLPPEYPLIRPGQTIFTYFHFAASRSLTEAMLDSGAACVAYETIENGVGQLPLLTPMSEVAGRMSVLVGSQYLGCQNGGRGILVSGVPGVEPGKVVVLGGGVVGTNAARIAAGLGAQVRIFDIDLDRLRYLDEVMPANVTTLFSNPFSIRKAIRRADLVIGAVLVAGDRAPVLVPRSYLAEMAPGSVIVDVAVDQGGCVESSRPTTHDEPTYTVDGIVHYCVANMPGAVSRTSTFALTNATQPYLLELAQNGLHGFVRRSLGHQQGLNLCGGKVFHRGVSKAFSLPLSPIDDLTEVGRKVR
ncbi:MAG TPA: alanine dehydrogenase [Planctomycetes bacterium]|nr:alanine dehydrogenase [Planctomycetota bacterium]HIN79922.1 alanine dehydrogenase [Planctomycetota bacterium]